MIKAIVKENCSAALDGINAISFKKGAEVFGPTAEWMIGKGLATEAKETPKPTKTKQPKPKETKPQEGPKEIV